MHGDEYIVLRGSKERDPDGKKVGAAIRAHLALERARRLRELFVHGVAAASILVWPLAAWRRLDSAPFRGLTLAFWAVTFIALVTTSIEEHRCHRRLSRLVADLRGPAQGD